MRQQIRVDAFCQQRDEFIRSRDARQKLRARRWQLILPHVDFAFGSDDGRGIDRQRSRDEEVSLPVSRRDHVDSTREQVRVALHFSPDVDRHGRSYIAD